MLSMPQVSGKETRSQNKRKNREKEDEDQQEQEEELHEEVEKVEDKLKCVGFSNDVSIHISLIVHILLHFCSQDKFLILLHLIHISSIILMVLITSFFSQSSDGILFKKVGSVMIAKCFWIKSTMLILTKALMIGAVLHVEEL